MKKLMGYEKVLDKARRLCSRREICRADVIERLISWEISETDRVKIIDLLEEEKFIDEARFARLYVQDKVRFNKWGKIKIRKMLRQKRIAEEITEAAMSEIVEENYRKMIRKFWIFWIM